MMATSVLGAARASFDLPQKRQNQLNPEQRCGGNTAARNGSNRRRCRATNGAPVECEKAQTIFVQNRLGNIYLM
jgi:hypothetical protein